MNRRIQKPMCILLSVMTMLAVLLETSMSTMAADTTNITSIRKGIYSTVFNVADNNYNGNNCTNLGGVSVGAANNRLFAVKSHNKEEISTFYYYNNLYDTKKAPKRIIFTGGLLGHANGMAVDDENVYVTMWTSSKSNHNKILKISRKAIGLLKDKTVVTSFNQTVKDGKNNIRICYEITAKKLNKTTNKYEQYTGNITAISKYSYNKETKETVFLINAGYNEDRSLLKYRKAVLNGTNLIVDDKVYNVYNTVSQTSVSEHRNCVMQDIFYDKSYGLLIPIWHRTDKYKYDDSTTHSKYEQVGVLNSIVQVNLNRPLTKFVRIHVRDSNGKLKKDKLGKYVYRVKVASTLTSDDVIAKNSKGEDDIFYAIKPTAVITVNADSAKFSKFELESVAFVTRNANKETGTFRVLMTCNKQEWKVKDKDEKGKMCDAVVELSNAKDVMLKL